jgi:hypothetical protein
VKNNIKPLAAFLVSVAILLVFALPIATTRAQTGTNSISLQVLDSLGGTTDPSPGTYTYDVGTQYTLTATPDQGFVFDHWVITGDIPGGAQALEDFDNPLTGNCGYGYTYQFQAVFTPENALSATPATIAVEYVAIIVVVLAVVCAVAAFAAFKAGKKRAK